IPAGLVTLDKIPINSTGKVDRAALPACNAGSDQPVEIPATDLERRLRDAWSEVLNVSVKGVDDNFFDLGGHSLLLHGLKRPVARHTGRSVPVLDFFDNPPIRTLAHHLAGLSSLVSSSPSSAPERIHPETAPWPAPIAIIGMAGRFPGA